MSRLRLFATSDHFLNPLYAGIKGGDKTSVSVCAPLEYGVCVWSLSVEFECGVCVWSVPRGIRVEKGYRAIGSIIYIPTDFNP